MQLETSYRRSNLGIAWIRTTVYVNAHISTIRMSLFAIQCQCPCLQEGVPLISIVSEREVKVEAFYSREVQWHSHHPHSPEPACCKLPWSFAKPT